MITIIDMVTGKIVQSGNGQVESVNKAIPQELPAAPMLQEITLQIEHKTTVIPADLATISVDEFLRNR